MNVIEEYKYYKSYESLLKKSESVFDTSYYISSFNELAEKAYKNHEPLDNLEFTLSSLESLKNSSGIQYEKTLEELKLEPQFDGFMEVISDMYASKYTESILPIEDSSLASDINSATNNTETVLDTNTSPIEGADIKMPHTNKTVLNVSGFGNSIEDLTIQNPEALITGDGWQTDKSKITTNIAEEARAEAFAESVATASLNAKSQVDFDTALSSIMDSFTPQSLTMENAVTNDEEDKQDDLIPSTLPSTNQAEFNSALTEEIQKMNPATVQLEQ